MTRIPVLFLCLTFLACSVSAGAAIRAEWELLADDEAGSQTCSLAADT